MTTPESGGRDAREAARRAADRLGDLVPSTSDDDTDRGWGEPAGSSHDDDLRRDVPPHHGG
ncbi:hypothetical protein HMPREF0063_11771 [Aeromicrobium marinum DSM 15272]|uniref:Uncharacterized protein n=1 Tax=Aeromicrobium marinum DSM 15272 TaxID=585531 RepID=E2SDI5_9ACTN|nr:hypothetical protein [Aeromicrobium marinum]EFQ82562.1 hypothetical protein HMPREF0063_11771 [Aeromicrobium marinum DSM 15272]